MLAALLLALPEATFAQAFDPDPENQAGRWLVVDHAPWADGNGNGNGIGDSEELALHYARRRGVPAANLLGLDVSIGTSTVYSGQTGWEAFYDEVVTPLQVAVGQWPEDHILGFVFCYGFPYQINAPGRDRSTRRGTTRAASTRP